MAYIVSITRGGTRVKNGLGVFREGTIIDDDLHGKSCS
jgi:hypothetical protein